MKIFNFICGSCGTKNNGKTHTRGSFIMELGLWLCFLIPGLIYSVWRLTTRRKVCTECNSPEIIGLETPRGKKLSIEFEV